MNKFKFVLLFSLSMSVLTATSAKPVPVEKKLEAACVDKVREGLGRTRIVDIEMVKGLYEKDVRFSLIDGTGKKKAVLCQVQQDGSLKVKDDSLR